MARDRYSNVKKACRDWQSRNGNGGFSWLCPDEVLIDFFASDSGQAALRAFRGDEPEGESEEARDARHASYGLKHIIDGAYEALANAGHTTEYVTDGIAALAAERDAARREADRLREKEAVAVVGFMAVAKALGIDTGLTVVTPDVLARAKDAAAALSELAALRADRDDADRRNADLSHKLAEADSDRRTLRDYLHAAEAQRDRYARQVTDLQAELAQLDARSPLSKGTEAMHAHHDHGFRPGDLVRLKSGGRQMVVREADADPKWTTCEWLADGGFYQKASIATTSLERADRRG